MTRRRALISHPLVIALAWYLTASPSALALDFHGFADISYRHDLHNDATPEENNGAFVVGPIDFFLAESLGPRVNMLAEFAFESGIVDVERLQIGYTFSDVLKVQAGRFHTALGYWNTAYHHGTFLYTTIERPVFLEFEDDGGLLPLHTVGLALTGRRFFPSGELSYHILVGNGSSITDEEGTNVLDPNAEADPNKNKAVGVRIAWAPSALAGWAVGASAFSSQVINQGSLVVPPAPAPALEVAQTIVGADITRTEGPLEILAEYFVVRDKDELAADTATHYFSYVQIGREFAGVVTPYARYEQMSIDEAAADPYMLTLGAIDQRIETVGVRTRLGDHSVLKFEGRFVTEDGLDSHQEYGAQWAFAF
ncbi:MAG: hypothetical protein AB1451_07570 [Nitrospirota bacterium]